ncbi:DUF971 domain-containing protein [Nitrosomonas sp.]|uniref:DUF971 domain-containing protein n=1 Tax=Nitrosomonas sp. TaxID=42353 RepID=UPI0025D561BD|nr:DUF971 domain-containing protein [Nitrosomonas sp.]
MAGLNPQTPIPVELKLHRKSGVLNVTFNDGKSFSFSCEFLRVYSPSAEVRGHEPGQAVLQTGKKNVVITHIEPVGRYAVRLDFSDGHNTGLYSWDLLYEYGLNQEAMWQDYLQRLDASGKSRDKAT